MDATEQTRRTAHAYGELLDMRDWPAWGALLSDDVVYELPQTRERIRGKQALIQFNVEYPGDWQLTVRRVVADSREAALWVTFDVGDDSHDALVWLELTGDGLISKITDFWPEPYDAPAGREHLTDRS
ncbi:SnoaL-like domain-containing protein [Actinoplanes sp. TBRC 11911]|uniref:nuclear transport factor 2 family protein n=1 Tax=Actinoplanes sp. TBRC 11911 TaxID=2729386 RepID=UPI00145D1438|nr:nuclear transport factor 2 family protein [Actinoplanes sp. TBRC 11911]NMO56246.1 SnoaL-like domain-containing protein [Actinoplanes sp. TBRC 11911]